MNVASLVKELDSAGDMPAGFGDLMHRVQRERFTPDQIWVDGEHGDEAIDRERDTPRWLRAVYSDRPIVTQFDDGRTKWPDVGKIPTCSASAPSVVGAMLEALGVKPGHSVLEIGTGTGFNAALLAETVGADGRMSTIEVDSAVMATANEHLWRNGYHSVRTITGDGAAGDPDLAPFDRVISTAAVQVGQLPYAWVEQTRPGGLIVAPMRAALSSGPLVVFEVGEDGTATGRAQPMGVGFMELRAQRTPVSGGVDWADERGDVGVTDIDAVQALSNPHSRWALAVALPSCRYGIDDATSERPCSRVWLSDPLSGSWATVIADSRFGTVRQFGPRRLWNEAQTALRWWLVNGRPARSAWTWTITPERQSVTLNPTRDEPMIDP